MRKRSVKEDGARQVSFELCTCPGSAVYIAGTFNDWRPGELRLREVAGQGVYRTKLRLPSGRHEYKFIVNEEWCADPACAEVTANDLGSLNSVIQVS